MSSKLDIVNQAISHLAVSTEIQNFDTDRTAAGQAARRYYDTARQFVLRSFDWPFAYAIEKPALVASSPTVEWLYSYRYPANALAIRRILNGVTRFDTLGTRALYAIGRDSAGKIVYANQTDAELQYTYDETDPSRFPPDFVIALSFYLAYLMAPRITGGGDTAKLKSDAFTSYRIALNEAKANAANEEPKDQPPEAEMISVRE